MFVRSSIVSKKYSGIVTPGGPSPELSYVFGTVLVSLFQLHEASLLLGGRCEP